MREKILKIIHDKAKFYPGLDFNDAALEIESLILSACEEQKRICANNGKLWNQGGSGEFYSLTKEDVLNSPLPSGIDSEDGWIEGYCISTIEGTFQFGGIAHDEEHSLEIFNILNAHYNGEETLKREDLEGYGYEIIPVKLKLPNPPKDK